MDRYSDRVTGYDLEESPPRRSREQLQAWVRDFLAQGYAVAGNIRVAPQEDADSQDTGLVIVKLHNSVAEVLIHPAGFDEILWEATLTGQINELVLTPHDMASLAAELVVAGNLCSYLQWRSLEWDRESGNHGD